MNPIGIDPQGAVVYAPDITAAAVLQQLESWKAKGYAPQLHSHPNGWSLVLTTDPWWGQREPNERDETMGLRFSSGVCATPAAAVLAAQEVVK